MILFFFLFIGLLLSQISFYFYVDAQFCYHIFLSYNYKK
jgi:hypothetical protein